MSTGQLATAPAGDHAHPEHVAHHFASFEQQTTAQRLGMWLFLAQEILFFGGLFVALFVFRAWYPDMWHAAYKQLSVPMGTLNTVTLIASSLTMALAVRSAQLGKNNQVFWLCAATFLLAGVFLAIKYVEYSHKFELGTLPGKYYTYEGLKQFPNAAIFFGLYFTMTALHGLHVIVGMGVIAWIMLRARRNEFGPGNFIAVDCVGLYWHLVDLIWIFLFSMLYLVG